MLRMFSLLKDQLIYVSTYLSIYLEWCWLVSLCIHSIVYFFILKCISVLQNLSVLYGYIQIHSSPASLENNFWKGTIPKTKSNTLESKNEEEENKLIYVKRYRIWKYTLGWNKYYNTQWYPCFSLMWITVILWISLYTAVVLGESCHWQVPIGLDIFKMGQSPPWEWTGKKTEYH